MADISDLTVHNRSRISAFHIVVVSLSLILTLAAWQFAKQQIKTRTEARFHASADRTAATITERMAKYEDALWAGVAAIDSHGGQITFAEWTTFARTLRIDEKYRGINGIGVIHAHTDRSLADYVAMQRQERPEFRVFPAHDQPHKMPITYITPETANAAAVGLDVAHEVNRRSAALASRDTGTARISGPITLVQDETSTPGFLFFAPFYENGARPDHPARESRFLGEVYAPFVVHKLMEGLLAKDLRDVRFSITDSGSPIYDEHSEEDAALDPDPMYRKQVALDLYGRTWLLDIRSDLTFRASNTYSQPTAILIAGLLIEALIISLLVLMSRANHQAISYANTVTAALRRQSTCLAEANATLVRKNDELEQFSYVASHDLKTPIRGIGGLVEMIQEDLADYFSAQNANPDVQSNLAHITERVGRMNELTSGILEYSRVDPDGIDTEPVNLTEVVEALVSDFELDDDQVQLVGNVTAIQRDTVNFRRVIENLVGNAVKYHDGAKRLQIKFSAQTDGENAKISIKDNGPGIEVKFHKRVFDVFQTLRLRDAPESTGIGLAIVKKAVERHGGKVTLTSPHGEGAEFSFSWPRCAPPASKVAIKNAA